MENEEKFEVTLRLFGTEVVGFKLQSESPRKMWIVMGTIVILLLTVVANQVLPLIQYFGS
jgi:hypothetical protein